MNVTLLSSEIVTKIRNSMQDSALNQSLVVEGMILEEIEKSNPPSDKKQTPILDCVLFLMLGMCCAMFLGVIGYGIGCLLGFIFL